METIKVEILCKTNLELWSYLQGMETSDDCFLLRFSVSGFDPTYKGWKLVWKPVRRPSTNCFDPTYKGWKLAQENLFKLPRAALWSYLQGMETAFAVRAGTRLRRLWSYLQGMETHNDFLWKVNLIPLWSYLQGMETTFCWIILDQTPEALILPTRDGNLGRLVSFVSGSLGFDPTYKGWKHNIL